MKKIWTILMVLVALAFGGCFENASEGTPLNLDCQSDEDCDDNDPCNIEVCDFEGQCRQFDSGFCGGSGEFCDGIDNDKDYAIDEGCDCSVDGLGGWDRNCGMLPPANKFFLGWQDCRDGVWTNCQYGDARKTESCEPHPYDGEFYDRDGDGLAGCDDSSCANAAICEDEWYSCNNVLDCAGHIDPGECWSIGCINNKCVPVPADYDSDRRSSSDCIYGGYPGGDCDDADDNVYPGAPEFCDGKDNDCDGEIDEGC